MNDTIEFTVQVTKARAEYLARMLIEPLCDHCNRELAECDADPCQHSPYGLQGRGDDSDNHQVQHQSTYVDAVRVAGNLCPKCGSDQIEGFGFNVEHDKASQRVICIDCPAIWYDQYALVGYIIESEGKPM